MIGQRLAGVTVDFELRDLEILGIEQRMKDRTGLATQRHKRCGYATEPRDRARLTLIRRRHVAS
jgi:hypothetical protein